MNRRFGTKQVITILLIVFLLIPLSKNLDVKATQDEIDWSVLEIEAEKVWSNPPDYPANVENDQLAGSGVNVAIMDQGVYLHWELNDRFDDPEGKNGWNGVEDGPNIGYIGEHGTHLAGVIAATDNGDGIIGVAPLVRLYSLVNAIKEGVYIYPSVPATKVCLQWAIDTYNDDKDYNNIKIINMSFGWGGDQSGLEEKCDNAKDKGIILVAAAGNNYRYGIDYPAWYNSTISVGAIDENRDILSYSNYGPKLDLVAPGINIKTTNTNNGFIDFFGGTSAATAFVTGVCALIVSAQASILPNSDLRPEEAKQILQKSATHLGEGEDGTRNDYFGFGLVNAKAAVDMVLTDFDQDGICDEIEEYLGLNPSNDDIDNDGLTDGEEHYLYNTEPEVFDTDGDGFSDGVEVLLKTDPLDIDDYPDSFPYIDDFSSDKWTHKNTYYIGWDEDNEWMNIHTSLDSVDDYSYKGIYNIPSNFQLKFRYQPLLSDGFSEIFIGLTNDAIGTWNELTDGIFFYQMDDVPFGNRLGLEAKINDERIGPYDNFEPEDEEWYNIYIRKHENTVDFIIWDASEQTILHRETLDVTGLPDMNFLYVCLRNIGASYEGFGYLDDLELIGYPIVHTDDFSTNQWSHTMEDYIQVEDGHLRVKTNRNSDEDYSYKNVEVPLNFELKFQYEFSSTDLNSYSFIGVSDEGDKIFNDIDNGIFLLHCGGGSGSNNEPFFRFYCGIDGVFQYSDLDSFRPSIDTSYIIYIRKIGTDAFLEVWNSDETTLLQDDSLDVGGLPQMNCLYASGIDSGPSYNNEGLGYVDNLVLSEHFYRYYDDFSTNQWIHTTEEYIQVENGHLRVKTNQISDQDYAYMNVEVPLNFELKYEYQISSDNLHSYSFFGVSDEGNKIYNDIDNGIFILHCGGGSGSNNEPFFRFYCRIDGVTQYSDLDSWRPTIYETYIIYIGKIGTNAFLEVWNSDETECHQTAELDVTGLPQLNYLYASGIYSGPSYDNEGLGYVDDLVLSELFYNYNDDFSNDHWTHENTDYINVGNDALNIKTSRAREDDYSYKVISIPNDFEFKFTFKLTSYNYASILFVGICDLGDNGIAPMGTAEKLQNGIFIYCSGGNSAIDPYIFLKSHGGDSWDTPYFTISTNNEYTISLRRIGSTAYLDIWDEENNGVLVASQDADVSGVSNLGCLYVGGVYAYPSFVREAEAIITEMSFNSIASQSQTSFSPRTILIQPLQLSRINTSYLIMLFAVLLIILLTRKPEKYLKILLNKRRKSVFH